MQIQAKIPAFDDFYRVLSQAKVVASPAEVHGVLCGFVCAGPKLNGCFWIDILLKRLGEKPRLQLGSPGPVVELYDAVCRQLGGLQSFALLLPDEHAQLVERAEALALWCEAFLYSLGLLESHFFTEGASDAVCEALLCISEIARLDIRQLTMTELDGLAYQETIEFITQAIPLIHEELAYYPVEGSRGSAYLH